MEAAAHLEKGLALLSGLPADAQRRQQELEFQIALGRAFQATKGQSSVSVGQTYARARQLCEELQNPPQLIPVLIGQCVYHLVRGEFDLARQHATALLELGESRNDVRLRLLGHRFSAQPKFCLGEFGAARSHLEEALCLFDPADRGYYAALTLQDAEVMLLNWHSMLFPLGYLDQARSRLAEALAQARRLEQAFTLAFTLFFMLLLNIHIGGRDGPKLLATVRHSDELMGIAEEKDFPQFAAGARVVRGWCLGALGEVNEGIELLNQGIASFRQLGGKLWLPQMLTLLAEAYWDGQRPELALERLAEAEEMIGETNERWFEAEVYRLRGQLFHSAGDCTSAEACFCKALDVASRQQAKFFQLCTARSLARLWRDQGKRTEARDLLAPVFGWFTEGFDTFNLKDARALLDELA